MVHTHFQMGDSMALADARADADARRRGSAGARASQDAHDAASHLTGRVLRNEPESTAFFSAHVPTIADEAASNPGAAEVAPLQLVVAQPEDALRFGSHGASSDLSAANHAVGHVAQAQDPEDLSKRVLRMVMDQVEQEVVHESAQGYEIGDLLRAKAAEVLRSVEAEAAQADLRAEQEAADDRRRCEYDRLADQYTTLVNFDFETYVQRCEREGGWAVAVSTTPHAPLSSGLCSPPSRLVDLAGRSLRSRSTDG